MIPVSTVAMSATTAPRIEIYTELACLELKPEYSVGRGSSPMDHLSIPGSDLHMDFHDYHGVHLSSHSAWQSVSVELSSFDDGTSSPSDEETPNRCATDPEVQAAVAKLITGETDYFSDVRPGWHPTSSLLVADPCCNLGKLRCGIQSKRDSYAFGGANEAPVQALPFVRNLDLLRGRFGSCATY